jgi:membrane-associated phospholipid phosphatase
MKLQSIIALDRDLSNSLRLQPEKRWLWTLTAFMAHSGDSWFWLAALFVIWLFTKQAWHANTALMATGILILAVLVLAIKFSIRRSRPPGEWGAIYRNTDPHSFPSGHAARAAMLAVLAIGLGPVWFAAVVLVWSPLVSLARIATGLHYLSDVLAGLILGVMAGLVMLQIAPWLMAFFPFIY